MELYKIKTKLFGEIEVSQTDGLTEDYGIILEDKEMNIELQIFENVVDSDSVKAVEDMLNHIPEMYKKAKKTILADMESNPFVKSFIEFYMDELDEYSDIFDVDSTDEVSEIMVAEKLESRGIFLSHDNNGRIECTFDFSLPEEYTDQLLVIRFNIQYEISDITWES